MLKWSMHSNRLTRKIGFIIGIICHLLIKQEHNLCLLIVSGENEDVTIGPLSSMMYVLPTTLHTLKAELLSRY